MSQLFCPCAPTPCIANVTSKSGNIYEYIYNNKNNNKRPCFCFSDIDRQTDTAGYPKQVDVSTFQPSKHIFLLKPQKAPRFVQYSHAIKNKTRTSFFSSAFPLFTLSHPLSLRSLFFSFYLLPSDLLSQYKNQPFSSLTIKYLTYR